MPYLLVVYWPSTQPNMPFQRRRKCIFHWHGRAGLAIWDRVKIPRYSHKQMHPKRVTCEPHDSYFRSMTIKHAIWKIEWAIELLYNSVKTGIQLVLETRSWRSDELETRCGRGGQHPAESWALGPLVEQPWRTRKTALMAIRVGVNILQFCSVSNSLSHTQPFK